MKAASGSQIGTEAVCEGCGVRFVRRKFMQQYHDNRCKTARGPPYGFVTQKGLRGHEGDSHIGVGNLHESEERNCGSSNS